MRHFSVYILFLAGMAAALRPVNANAGDGFVDIQSIDPTIVVDLRYAGRNNFVKQPLYPLGTRALARPEVASALTRAQAFLRRYSYGLKIWDAYRPVTVQSRLWQALHNSDYVANPAIGVGSLHSYGVAVDATLVDSWDRPVLMPSDFDDFSPAAMWRYAGSSAEIRSHVRLLQYAMYKAGFWGLRTEWWHFTLADWQKYLPPEKVKNAAQVSGSRWDGRL